MVEILIQIKLCRHASHDDDVCRFSRCLPLRHARLLSKNFEISESFLGWELTIQIFFPVIVFLQVI